MPREVPPMPDHADLPDLPSAAGGGILITKELIDEIRRIGRVGKAKSIDGERDSIYASAWNAHGGGPVPSEIAGLEHFPELRRFMADYSFYCNLLADANDYMAQRSAARIFDGRMMQEAPNPQSVMKTMRDLVNQLPNILLNYEALSKSKISHLNQLLHLTMEVGRQMGKIEAASKDFTKHMLVERNPENGDKLELTMRIMLQSLLTELAAGNMGALTPQELMVVMRRRDDERPLIVMAAQERAESKEIMPKGIPFENMPDDLSSGVLAGIALATLKMLQRTFELEDLSVQEMLQHPLMRDIVGAGNLSMEERDAEDQSEILSMSFEGEQLKGLLTKHHPKYKNLPEDDEQHFDEEDGASLMLSMSMWAMVGQMILAKTWGDVQRKLPKSLLEALAKTGMEEIFGKVLDDAISKGWERGLEKMRNDHAEAFDSLFQDMMTEEMLENQFFVVLAAIKDALGNIKEEKRFKVVTAIHENREHLKQAFFKTLDMFYKQFKEPLQQYKTFPGHMSWVMGVPLNGSRDPDYTPATLTQREDEGLTQLMSETFKNITLDQIEEVLDEPIFHGRREFFKRLSEYHAEAINQEAFVNLSKKLATAEETSESLVKQNAALREELEKCQRQLEAALTAEPRRPTA